MTSLPPLFGRGLRRLVNLPRYGPVGLQAPQHLVDVFFEGHGEPKNVTANNVVAALRPFTIGVMFEAGSAPNSSNRQYRLCFREREGSRDFLGAFDLRMTSAVALPGHRFCLFETSGGENRCVSRLSLQLYHLLEKRRASARRRRNPYNFQMEAGDLHRSHIFYLCPRPVVLVTVAHEGSGNMFPMDLIGPTDSPWFSMALRLTSPAVRLMQESRRMALAAVPIFHKDIAYQLGQHHRKESIDWTCLPFGTTPSPQFGLPVSENALRVTEVKVAEFRQVGSHMLFVTSVVSDTQMERTDETQLFHAFSSYRRFLGLNCCSCC
jgi:flavin reductase (DIM6/NTAB) family NADH-FMN oxidoreductase RutF